MVRVIMAEKYNLCIKLESSIDHAHEFYIRNSVLKSS